MKMVLRLLGVCLLTAACSAVAAGAAPDAVVKSTVDEVLAIIRQNRDKHALREIAEQKVLPHFDFRRMTQLAVGAAWRQADAAQQQALENSFRALLVNTYTSALSVSAPGTQSVEVKPAPVKADQNEVTVRTVAKDAGSQPVAIDYRMEKTGDGWKVFDVVVENVSLVINYRGTFAGEIGRSGIDGLIKVLAEKNRALAGT